MTPYDVDQVIPAKAVAEIKIDVQPSCGSPSIQHILPLYANKTVRIGRDICNNDFPITDPAVSRNHLEFYSVVFEEGSNHFPLVYVRDRQSHHGTHVNNEPLSDGKSITPARLLQHGDKVTIPPHVTFELVQPFTPQVKLSRFQSEEVKLFGDRFIVTDRTLGEGSAARVHLAIDRKTREQVACKVYDLYNMDKSGHDDMIRRLIQETYIRCQLEHPNLAPFRGAYKSRSTLYIFEDLATGGDLFSLMLREREFSESDVRWMVRQVVSAIAYMHEKGVVHRDLKLENILCAICPKPGHRLVVTDFGHSGVVGQGRMDSVVGTQGWQAPELLKPNQQHGTPVDIWSIGVLATQLLAGAAEMNTLSLLDTFARYTFHQREPNYVLERIFSEISDIRSESISEQAKDFICRCFSINPQTRMSAADAMKHPWLCEPDEDLKKFLQREEETTANWKLRAVLENVVKDLPDLRQRIAYGSPYFTPREYKQGSHAIRRTVEYKKRSSEKTKTPRKRSRMQDISMVPHYQGLERRLMGPSRATTRASQKQLLKELAESGKMFFSRYPVEKDGDERASNPKF